MVTVGSLSFSSVLVELAGLELRVDIVANDLKAWNRKYSPFRWVVGEDISHYWNLASSRWLENEDKITSDWFI